MTAHIDSTASTRSLDLPAETLRDEIKLRLKVPPWVLLVELFIGLGWVRAAVEKIVDPTWWDGSGLSGFLELHAALTLPWYEGFVEAVIAPNLLAVSIVVVIAQLFAGIALISGWKLSAGLATGLFLNLNFVAAGAVDPSIFYLVCQTALLLWILHDENGAARRPLRLLALTSLAVALLNVPFIWTLDPTWVVKDPAAALVTLGFLTAVASLAGIRRSAETRDARSRATFESQSERDSETTTTAARHHSVGSRWVG